jgi:hypothetical protein
MAAPMMTTATTGYDYAIAGKRARAYMRVVRVLNDMIRRKDVGQDVGWAAWACTHERRRDRLVRILCPTRSSGVAPAARPEVTCPGAIVATARAWRLRRAW